MGCNILVGNRAGGKGEISSVSTPDTNYTHNESLSAWLVKFPNRPTSEYHRNFSIIKASDKTKKELDYLTDAVIINGEPFNKWYFLEPDSSSPEWIELFQTGEITKPFDEISPYLRERT